MAESLTRGLANRRLQPLGHLTADIKCISDLLSHEPADPFDFLV